MTLGICIKCHCIFFVMLNAILLSISILNVIMLNVIMLNIIMLNIIMLNIIMLNIFILNIMAPPELLFFKLVLYHNNSFITRVPWCNG
jgi:hypothetical protein